jgi:hypothetical protein
VYDAGNVAAGDHGADLPSRAGIVDDACEATHRHSEGKGDNASD